MPRKTAQALWTIALVALVATPSAAQERPTVGVAFGGGGARGIAHIGVIKWFEEHHIPIDMAAGISVGGLIGGAFATGMPAAELEAMLAGIDWDEMFGFSNFSFKNIRRKTDQRAYPSRLEFGLKGRLSMPTSLNNGQQVDLLLSRIAAAYHATPSFDSLPTPFRVVATDLRTATPVVIGRGSLAQAMRATVSLPGVFPPVELDGRVLVDGGVMNNVPADVARSMGAGVVVAVNVGDLSDNETISYSVFGLAGATIDAMMRANTKAGIASADIVINVPPTGFGTLDWRKSAALIAEGYKAAEATKDTLLTYAVDNLAWQAWLDGRAARRKQALPVPAFAGLDGVAPADQRRMHKLLAKHVGVPLDMAALEIDLEELSGLDRYESITWQLGPNPAGDIGLTIRARPKPYAPPLLMLGINLENTTTDDFTLGLAARYLRFDVLRSGSELRADVQVGANPSAAVAVYTPLYRATFLSPYAGIGARTLNQVVDDVRVAQYEQSFSQAGLDVGINLGLDSDVRVGGYVGHLTAKVKVGDPGLPEVSGAETVLRAQWRLDTQDSHVVPSRGVNAQASFRYVVDGPYLTEETGEPVVTERSSVDLSQFEVNATRFWSPGERNRVFFAGGAGSSFGRHPSQVDQFLLGLPFRLGAYDVAEIRGDNYWIATFGYLRELGRLPDFLGGPVFAGTWVENGDAPNEWTDTRWRTHWGGGLIMETLIGPVFVGGTAGFDGRWRTYVGVGRLLR